VETSSCDSPQMLTFEGYIFDRPERVPDEMQVWHAARATSAAPRYFKPFRSPTTTKEYWDGALYHNNPIIVANHERRLLWPDVAASHPDVVLSIGTGHKRPEGGETSSETSSFGQTTLEPQTSDGNSKKEWSQKPRWAQLWGVLVHRVRDILDSDRRWDDFLRDIDASSNTITQQRYQRINVYLGRDPPELDDVNQVEWMRAQTEERLKNNPKYSLQVQEVAHQLLASCFFFEKSASNPVDCPLGFQVAGVIRCRFLAGSNELRNLGNVLSGKQNGDFQPYFKVVEYEETGNTGMPQLFTLQEGVIRNMQARAEFKPQPLVVEVSRHGAKTTLLFYVSSGSGCPVSGFPRSLLDDESLERKSNIALLRSDRITDNHSITSIISKIHQRATYAASYSSHLTRHKPLPHSLYAGSENTISPRPKSKHLLPQNFRIGVGHAVCTSSFCTTQYATNGRFISDQCQTGQRTKRKLLKSISLVPKQRYLARNGVGIE
jgi:hypothetical protein